jgi:N-acetylmuramoyl-L-alanine amidase
MKFAIRLILGWIALCASSAHAASGGRSDVFNVGGVEYRRIEDFARARGLQVQWIVPRKSARLTGAATLSIESDARLVVVNGIAVYLSWPVARGPETLLLSRQDIESTLNPILAGTRSRGGKIRTIAIDPGHGGIDPGNREGRISEKTYTMLLAKELGAQLTKAGFKVIYTRASDSFVDLDDRAVIARKRGADLLLSLHFNSVGSGSGASVRGSEVYCMTPARASSTNAQGKGSGSGSYPGNVNDPQNIVLAYQVQKSLVNKLGAEDRGVRRARFAILRNATMPSVLIEGGYMSNAAEAKKIYSSDWRRQLAQAITSGVLNYKKIVEG